ncbi:MAG: reverse transcriptase domain-containing protein, partial [Solirubrobacteraceae bacterium]
GNVYLHCVFDLWAHQWRKRQARGDVVLVRYADDAVVGFARRDDAERFLADLRDRLAEFGLEVADEKTRLIEFGRFAAQNRERRGDRRPETFTFLGFTHICATTKKGRFKLKRSTSKKKMRAKTRSVKTEMRKRAHLPIPEQGAWLASVLIGHYRYYAVPDNSRSLAAFRDQVRQLWLRSLRRRSQRHRMTWDRYGRLADRWLPRPRILHPWPTTRFHANHPR